MNYAHMGKLDVAKKYIELSINERVREYYILNNMAVINMLESNFTYNVLDDLKTAYILNSNPYDNIIIACNLLVCCIKMKQHNELEKIKNHLLSVNIQKYNYEELQHIYYQNLLFYYESCEDDKKILEYNGYIKELLESLDKSTYTYKILKLQFEKKYDKNVFFSKFRFRVDFLGYWDFNIDLDDFL